MSFDLPDEVCLFVCLLFRSNLFASLFICLFLYGSTRFLVRKVGLFVCLFVCLLVWVPNLGKLKGGRIFENPRTYQL